MLFVHPKFEIFKKIYYYYVVFFPFSTSRKTLGPTGITLSAFIEQILLSLSELKVFLLHSNLNKQKKESLACISNMCRETETNLFVLVHFHVCIGRSAQGQSLKTHSKLSIQCAVMFSYSITTVQRVIYFPFEKLISNQVPVNLLALALACTIHCMFLFCCLLQICLAKRTVCWLVQPVHLSV